MRTLDEWNVDQLKCTLFIMNGRYSLKVENQLLEQTYKFRDGQFKSADQLKEKLSPEFYASCQSTFSLMNDARGTMIDASELGEDFPIII